MQSVIVEVFEYPQIPPFCSFLDNTVALFAQYDMVELVAAPQIPPVFPQPKTFPLKMVILVNVALLMLPNNPIFEVDESQQYRLLIVLPFPS